MKMEAPIHLNNLQLDLFHQNNVENNTNPISTASGGNKLDTLAPSGTGTTNKNHVLVYGEGSNITNKQILNNKAKKKSITQVTMLNLIKIAQKTGDKELEKAFKNTYYCMSKAIVSENKMYGKYCKNRFCEVCSGIRKAKMINKYLPIIEKWEEPYFVTLTIKACSVKRLNFFINKIVKEFRLIKNRLRKRYTRGKGPLFMGIKTMECNFNPFRYTYNPHLHLIVPKKEMAELLISEWLKQWGKKYTSIRAQHYRAVKNTTNDLIEIIKYGTKIISNGPKNQKGKLAPKIHIKAIYNIIDAFRHHMLFNSFGFTLPKAEKVIREPIEIESFQEITFLRKYNNWINMETGETLSGFIVNLELNTIYTSGIDLEME